MRIVFAILVSILLSSCAVADIFTDAYYTTKFQQVSLYHSDDFSTLTTPKAITTYIHNNIHQVSEEVDSWSAPKDTLMRGYGDCEDWSILYLNILYYSTGKRGSLALVAVPGRAVVNGGTINHAVVEVNGIQIEPQTGKVCNYKVGYRYTFEEVFNL